jgi:sugar phosphate isomerase/epimerase
MPRPVLLFSNGWVNQPIEELAAKASEWGYAGFELSCWGDHFEVQRALSERDYGPSKLELMARYDLQIPILSNHRTGQAVCDPIDIRHKAILPDYVWGDGKAAGVRQRAIEEMTATFRAAQKIGATVVGGFTGSPLWSYVGGYPAPTPEIISAGFQDFVNLWNPILDVAADEGIKFAFEVHPGQIAYDYYSTEMALDAMNGRPEFGLTFDPSHLHWQGIDPIEFIRRFGDRIYHVHVKDAVLALNGRTSILNSYLPAKDPRRGWYFRVPGRGGVDWEGIIRALNEVGYSGPLAVEFSDAAMDRDFGAREACDFVKRLDFDHVALPPTSAFK